MMGKEAASLRNRDIVTAVAAAFLAATLVKIAALDLIVSEGNSMRPALSSGALLVVNKLAYGARNPFSGAYLVRWKEPRRGDIVVFYTPLGDFAVKRCVKVAGGVFFAAGDNVVESYDSRSYGPVPLENIVGQVINYR